MKVKISYTASEAKKADALAADIKRRCGGMDRERI